MRRKNAFALIDLLTAMAVMLVLVGLFLPILGKARERAWRASCVNNQRQLTLTWMMYAGDNDERLAQNGYTYGGGEANRPMWAQGYYNHYACPVDSTNALLLTDRRFSQFASYLSSPNVYHCPANRHMVQLKGPKGQSGARVVKIRSYSMNWFLGWNDEPGLRNPPPELRRFYKTCDLQRATPSQLLVFTDLHPDSICWPFFGISARPEFFMFPGSYHNRSGIIAWADGHVESRKWADDRTMGAAIGDAPVSSTGVNWHMHQHPSPDNPDLIWIQAHGSIAR